MGDKTHDQVKVERWWLVPAAGFLGGTSAMFVLTEATRLVRLLAPIDNLGLLKLDLMQSFVWGIFSTAVYALTNGKTAQGNRLPLHVFMTGLALSFVMIGLLVVSRLNGALKGEVWMAFVPLVALGPVSAALSIAWSRRLASAKFLNENA